MLKKASRERELPTLNEDDLEETFIKGRGPGGQCINKRSTNVNSFLTLLYKADGNGLGILAAQTYGHSYTVSGYSLTTRQSTYCSQASLTAGK